MSVDARMRKELIMIKNELPTVDAVEGYEDFERGIRRATRRRRALIGAAAAAVVVAAASAVVLLSQHGQDRVSPARVPHTTTFRSPLYGYAIVLPKAWTATPATRYADDPKSTDRNSTDSIHVPSTDTTIDISAVDLGSQTYAAWANALHRDVLNNPGIPSGCDGGDPSQWPTVPVGHSEGHLLQLCNAAQVLVPDGKRVYVFNWGNRTFTEGQHYPQVEFEKLLSGVSLPDAETAHEPLWPPSPSQGG
jgi:hypothetical protein